MGEFPLLSDGGLYPSLHESCIAESRTFRFDSTDSLEIIEIRVSTERITPKC